MKSINRILISTLLLMILLLAFPTTVFAQSNGDKLVLGGSYTLQNGEVLDGNLVVLGGTATLEDGSTVTGDVMITGGTLYARGKIDGGITAIGGTIYLQGNALVLGDVNLASANFNRENSAVVEGTVNYNSADLNNLPWDFNPSNILPRNGISQAISNGLGFIGSVLWAIVQILAFSVLAAVVALLLPKPTERVAQSLVAQPVLCGGLGFLTAIVGPALLILLSITIILLPVGLLGLFALAVTLLFGWIAVGMETGRRIALLFKQEWAPAINAGLGTLVITFVANIIGRIPCVGWILPTFVAIIGLGAVIISRYGTRVYQPGGTTMVSSGKQEQITPGS
jgi:hypothetical protein